jgi:beta-lactamase regulating signal transducer with metallopeptidase domain
VIAWWLGWTLRGAVVFAALLVVERLGHRAAARRHTVLALAFGAALLLPAARTFSPTVELAVLPPAKLAADEPAPAAPGSPTAVPTVGAVATSPVTGEARWTAPTVAQLAAGLWLLGFLLLTARRVRAELRLRKLERESHAFDDPVWVAMVGSIAAELGVRRDVRLITHPDATTPATWGVWRPVVLLPADAAAWSVDRRRAVLLHELSHVGRADALVHCLAGIARDLHWHDPLAWTAARRLRTRREQACDDEVLQRGAHAASYARLLLRLARRGAPPLLPAAAGFALFEARSAPGELEQRLTHLLDSMDRTDRPRPARLLGTLSLLGLAALPAFGVELVPRTGTEVAPAAPEPAREARAETLDPTADVQPVAGARRPVADAARPDLVLALAEVRRATDELPSDAELAALAASERKPIARERREQVRPSAKQAPAPKPAPPVLSKREQKLPRAFLLPRTRENDDYVRATYNFWYSTRDDVRLTLNNWDLQLADWGQGLRFNARMVVGDRGSVTDLGPVDAAGVTTTKKKLAKLEATDGVPVVLGHTYLIHNKDANFDYWVAGRVVAVHPRDGVELAWRMLRDDSDPDPSLPKRPKRKRR